jgi:hypothetical protein
LLATYALPASAYQQYNVAVSLERPVASLGEPILIDLEIKNLSGADRQVDLGANRESNLQISVKDPSGITVRKPDNGRHEGVEFFGVISIPANQRHSQAIVLNKWFAFDQIGKYIIEIKVLGNSSLGVDVMRLDLQVTSANADELAEACSKLATRLLSSSVEQSLAAASALSYVRDPVVVPIWQSVINRPGLARFAILGLAQVGNSQAANALLQALNDSDSNTRPLIRSALLSIADNTADQAIRSSIQAALANP